MGKRKTDRYGRVSVQQPFEDHSAKVGRQAPVPLHIQESVARLSRQTRFTREAIYERALLLFAVCPRPAKAYTHVKRIFVRVNARGAFILERLRMSMHDAEGNILSAAVEDFMTVHRDLIEAGVRDRLKYMRLPAR